MNKMPMNNSNIKPLPPVLHEDASSATLITFLKYFFAIWFLRYLFDPLYTLSELPLAYGYPTGWLAYMPLAWYEAIHSFWGLLILKIAILACCIGVWSQRWRLQSAIAGCVLITTANAITRRIRPHQPRGTGTVTRHVGTDHFLDAVAEGIDFYTFDQA